VQGRGVWCRSQLDVPKDVIPTHDSRIVVNGRVAYPSGLIVALERRGMVCSRALDSG
jgi:hypothetical protein